MGVFRLRVFLDVAPELPFRVPVEDDFPDTFVHLIDDQRFVIELERVVGLLEFNEFDKRDLVGAMAECMTGLDKRI